MRTLARNQTSLWMVRLTGTEDAVDGDGNYTGEKINTYSTPNEISLSMYPDNGLVSRETFGVADLYDMVAVTTEYDLEDDDLLFLYEPTVDYDSTYDYYVAKKLASLNSFTYGLKARV